MLLGGTRAGASAAHTGRTNRTWLHRRDRRRSNDLRPHPGHRPTASRCVPRSVAASRAHCQWTRPNGHGSFTRRNGSPALAIRPTDPRRRRERVQGPPDARRRQLPRRRFLAKSLPLSDGSCCRPSQRIAVLRCTPSPAKSLFAGDFGLPRASWPAGVGSVARNPAGLASSPLRFVHVPRFCLDNRSRSQPARSTNRPAQDGSPVSSFGSSATSKTDSAPRTGRTHKQTERAPALVRLTDGPRGSHLGGVSARFLAKYRRGRLRPGETGTLTPHRPHVCG
jgi:hypothetical protein